LAARAREAGVTQTAYQRKPDVDEALREFSEPWSTVLAGGAGVILAVIIGLVLVALGQPPGAAPLGTAVAVLGGVPLAVVVALGLARIFERMARRSRLSMRTYEDVQGILLLVLLMLLLLLPATLAMAVTLALA
jgi:uncharacterized membrane protein